METIRKNFTMRESNKELIKKISEEVSKGNNEFFNDFVSDDIRWNIVGMPAIYGKENFIKAIQMLELGNFPAMVIKNIIAEGDYVVVESTCSETDNSGKTFNPSYCDVYRFKEAKIQELTTYVVDTSLNE